MGLSFHHPDQELFVEHYIASSEHPGVPASAFATEGDLELPEAQRHWIGWQRIRDRLFALAHEFMHQASGEFDQISPIAVMRAAEVIDRVRSLLAPPANGIAPMPDGGLLFEGRVDDLDYTCEILPDGTVEFDSFRGDVHYPEVVVRPGDELLPESWTTVVELDAREALALPFAGSAGAAFEVRDCGVL